MSRINSLSCPTFAQRPTESQCVFSRLSHRSLAALTAHGGRRKLAHASNWGGAALDRLCMTNNAVERDLHRAGKSCRQCGFFNRRNLHRRYQHVSYRLHNRRHLQPANRRNLDRSIAPHCCWAACR